MGPAFRSSQYTYNTDYRETDFGYGISFQIGYSWNKRDMIVWQRDGIIIKRGTTLHFNLLGGFCYYHYFGIQGRSFSINTGVFPFSENILLMGGLGYRLARHFHINLNLRYYNKEKVYKLMLTVTALVY